VPAFALKTLYGEMSTIVLNGVNMVPRRATDLGFRFAHPEIDEALSSTLA
jgi:NAD dependent epimerase/dehydratase family enzyme